MKVKLELTPAQARVVNEALAYHESMVDAGDTPGRLDLVERTRTVVHEAMQKAGVRP